MHEIVTKFKDNELVMALAKEIIDLKELSVSGLPKCDFNGCQKDVMFEGYYAVRDPLCGNKTGVLRLVHVCKEHAKHLYGGEEAVKQALKEDCEECANRHNGGCDDCDERHNNWSKQ